MTDPWSYYDDWLYRQIPEYDDGGDDDEEDDDTEEVTR